MKFTSHKRLYELDSTGTVTQLDHRPYKYDPEYSAIYDQEKYKRESDILQALRLGFVQGVHGKRINSLMDVGYGNGAFINFAKKSIKHLYGHDVTGVPLDGAYSMPELVKADVYTFWDVLEHFPELDFVRTIQAETICVSLPYCHIMELGIDWFSNNYHHRKPDEHIRHFNEYSLNFTMAKLGWSCVAVSNHEDIIRKSKDPDLQNILTMAFKK